MRYFILLFLTSFCALIAQPKVVLFNDTSEWYHWGCTGTTTALKEGINSLGFEIRAFPIHATYSLKEVPEIDQFNDWQKFEKFQAENREIAEAIQAADAVVINGEGTLHGMSSGPRSLLYLAHLSKKFFNKHVEIINHSAYPLDDPVLDAHFYGKKGSEADLIGAKNLYQAVYSALDFIAIREPISQEEMHKIGVDSILSFDCLPLYIRDHYRTPKEIKEKTLVVAGSVAFTHAGAETVARYMELMAKAGFKIKVLIGAKGYPAKDDVRFVEILQTHCRAPWELVNAASMEEWLDTLNHATLLVSGRFHHSIAAFCLNTPFIALNSNTHKVHALSLLFGQKPPPLFADPSLLEKLLERTEEILTEKVDNRLKIDEICALAEKNFEGLSSLYNF